MDQNGENIPAPDEDDLFLWDDFPTVDDDEATDSFLNLERDNTIDQWLAQHPIQFGTIGEDDSSSGLVATNLVDGNSPAPMVVTNNDDEANEFDNLGMNNNVDQWIAQHPIQFGTFPYGEMFSGGEIFTYEGLVELTEQIGNVCIGLSAETIDQKLSRRKYEEDCDEKKSCVICLDELKHNDEVSRLECGHEFHFECIKEWLMIKNMCPLCKERVV